jgi:hypothetical protein
LDPNAENTLSIGIAVPLVHAVASTDGWVSTAAA